MWADPSEQRNAPAAATAAADAPLFVVMNPGSGRKESESARERVAAVFREAGRRFEFFEFDAHGGIVGACRAAARRAVEQGGILVAAGGDGTLNCGAQAALAAGCTLAVIPQGTFNLFGRNMGIPQDAEAAARALLRAAPQPVQVGTVNGEPFLVNASLGLYPQLLQDRETFKEKIGRRRWVAMLSALWTLFEWRRQLVLEAELEGKPVLIRTPTLFVCNNRLQLERIGIEPEVAAQVGEGRLAGIVVKPIGTLAMLGLVLRGALGRLGEADQVRSFALRSLTVRPWRVRGVKMKLATDGEVRWVRAPLRFEVSPQPLRLLVPAPEDRVPVE
jgi:diacylglycerol kinase family enzyme